MLNARGSGTGFGVSGEVVPVSSPSMIAATTAERRRAFAWQRDNRQFSGLILRNLLIRLYYPVDDGCQSTFQYAEKYFPLVESFRSVFGRGAVVDVRAGSAA